ncbi:MAG: LysE family translocator [Alphaproteobacteria bacterium]|nr:LysE family translocator [Alphaproteobacteria bacterium]
MPSLDLLLSFALATLVFAIIPGPAILYTAAQTLARGRRGGLLASLGIHIGGFVHVIAAAAGLSAVLELVPDLYAAVKLVGAAYLVWLGWTLVRQRFDPAALPEVRDRDARRAFLESILVEALNPKAAMFYLAFLPQFVDAGAVWPVWVQFLVLGWVVNLTFSIADLVTVALTDRLLTSLRHSQTGARLLRVTGGATLMGLGLHLATSRQ